MRGMAAPAAGQHPTMGGAALDRLARSVAIGAAVLMAAPLVIAGLLATVVR